MKRLASVFLGAAMVALTASAASASTIELIVNGDFESGSLLGWTVTDLAGGTGTWSWDTPGTTTPISGQTTLSTAANGTGYAVTDQGGPGTHTLTQAFSVAPSGQVTLSFDMFANDYDSGPIVNAGGLNHTLIPNQHVRVDILSAGAGAFDTGATVLGNFYIGVDAGADPNPFTSYSFDITALVGAGGNFILRFAEVDNQLFLNMGVDNVSIQAVPEPASLLMLGMAVAGAAARARRRKQ